MLKGWISQSHPAHSEHHQHSEPTRQEAGSKREIPDQEKIEAKEHERDVIGFRVAGEKDEGLCLQLLRRKRRQISLFTEDDERGHMEEEAHGLHDAASHAKTGRRK